MKLDETTGLPPLPEGFFFRVGRFTLSSSSYTLKVQLRARRLLGSVCIGESLAETSSESIRNAARYAIKAATASGRLTGTLHTREQYVGDYPPKSLGGAS